MKNLKIFFITLVSLFLINFQEREKKIDFINLSYNGGLRIPFNIVSINIKKTSNDAVVKVFCKPSQDKPEWKYSQIDTTFHISLYSFDKLAESVSLLKTIKIDDTEDGLDGSFCMIGFGSKNESNRYGFWYPESETNERGLVEFMNASEQIVEIANLKKEDVFFE